MLLVDTGPLVAYLNRNDPDHARCAELLASRTDELLVTPNVVTEACRGGQDGASLGCRRLRWWAWVMLVR
jgi:predicted nucleic acid-binding protein